MRRRRIWRARQRICADARADRAGGREAPVEYWAGQGMTSYKAYMNITREELGAAIAAAHARKMKLTGHLCSVTWREASGAGNR